MAICDHYVTIMYNDTILSSVKYKQYLKLKQMSLANETRNVGYNLK